MRGAGFDVVEATDAAVGLKMICEVHPDVVIASTWLHVVVEYFGTDAVSPDEVVTEFFVKRFDSYLPAGKIYP